MLLILEYSIASSCEQHFGFFFRFCGLRLSHDKMGKLVAN
jgi:hypothetical protein